MKRPKIFQPASLFFYDNLGEDGDPVDVWRPKLFMAAPPRRPARNSVKMHPVLNASTRNG
jgi:hypothetical protein